MTKINSVLLVDDNDFTNYVNDLIIKRENIANETIIAKGGADALEIIQKYHSDNSSLPELILLDIKMPGINGIDFLNKLKQLDLKHSAVIVMLTAFGNLEYIDQVKQFGITDIIRKPFTQEKLLEIWNKYFNKN